MDFAAVTRHSVASMRRILICLFMLGLLAPSVAAEDRLLVFSASSLTDALTEIAGDFEAETGKEVRVSFAASSALARQIETGAPADLLISANFKWLQHLEERSLISSVGRRPVALNRLALAAPTGSGAAVTLDSPRSVLSALGNGRLAVAETATVPLGIYSRQALEAMGLWRHVNTRLAPAANARATLALVETGAVPLGLVYATDAAASRRVTVLAMIPEASHEAVTYWAALVSGRESEGARALLAYLAGEAARGVFNRHGFSIPRGEPGPLSQNGTED